MSSEIGNELTENLVEVAIKTLRNNDGSFDEIVFYGRGPRGFDSSEPLGVSFTQNPYANVNTYWLSIPRDSTRLGKRVAVSDSTFDNPVLLDYAISHSYAEEDLENPFDSGLLWVGPGFTRNQTVSVVFDLHHPKRQVDSSVRLSVFGGTASESDDHPSHRVNIYQGSISGPLLDSRSWAGLSAKELSGDLDATRLVDGPNSIVFENASTDMASKIHLDWTMLTYGSELRWEDAALEFWAPPNVPAALFAIARANSEVTVWDITEFVNPVQQTVKLSVGVGYFETSLPQDRPGRFIAFTDQTAREVTVVVPDQDNSTSDLPFSQLRTTRYPVDHIIIAPEEFLGPAQKLSQHRTNSTVVLLKAIYDEFSGGVQDPLAIRYFLKWTKENWRNPADNSFPSFVLLFGDGDYDYRNITGNSHNRVLTFQSSQPKGVSSDDRFAYLDGNTPEMAIGRFPAVSLGDATNMTDKTIAYESDPEIGLWRRRVTLIADDFARPNFGRIELTHTKNSESVARMVPPSLELEKLYMEDFPQVNTGTQFGVTKPEATEALFDALERGTVLLNYIGHGSPYQWAQEGLLSAARGDLSSINTGMKLPIWMAATCSWGRYDNVEGSAMSEEILRLPDNGAIAIISTTGLITFSENRDFILSLFKSFFPHGRVTEERLGTVYHSIKDGSVGSQKFHLFG
ncbi:MAG: C25 family cysteine peptidase, partial [Fidelibacterota bacterium]